MRKFFLLLALSPLSVFAAESNFTHAVYSEVIKEVDTVFGNTGKVEKAKSGAGFSSQDFVKSGRGSRAQLTVPDGTIIRVGPNAIFSLDKTSRTVKLKSGTILFYTPPGNGGGKIVTDSVTCAVTGTTIIVTVDPKTGEYTIQVLEGHATVTNDNGDSISIEAGEKISIPLGYKGPLVTQTFSTADVKSSILINGFGSELASAAKIVDALGGLPGATPEQIAAGTDTGITGGGTDTSTGTGTTTSGSTPGTTSIPAQPGATVIPNTGITSAIIDPQTGRPITISPNGEGQLN